MYLSHPGVLYFYYEIQDSSARPQRSYPIEPCPFSPGTDRGVLSAFPPFKPIVAGSRSRAKKSREVLIAYESFLSKMRPTAPGQSALLLLDVIDLLNKRHIPYAIIGAFAASFYGVVRASLDADAVISIRTVRDGNELCQDLKVLGLSVERRTGDHEDPIAAVVNIRDSFHNRVLCPKHPRAQLEQGCVGSPI